MIYVVRAFRSSGGYSFGVQHGLDGDCNTALCGLSLADDDRWNILDDESQITCDVCLKKYAKSKDKMVRKVEKIIGLPFKKWKQADPIELIEACHSVMESYYDGNTPKRRVRSKYV